MSTTVSGLMASRTPVFYRFRKDDSLYGQLRSRYGDLTSALHQCTLAPLVVCFWHLIERLDPEMLTSDIRLYRLWSNWKEKKKKTLTCKNNAFQAHTCLSCQPSNGWMWMALLFGRWDFFYQSRHIGTFNSSHSLQNKCPVSAIYGLWSHRPKW